MIKISKPKCPNSSVLQGDYKHPVNKNALVDASSGKCMYCESKITHVYFGDVEHIKPKSKFPSLQFDWFNLGFSCAKCNSAKSDKYDENTPHINPYDEDPEEHLIAWGALLKTKNASERGEITILDINLNRPELIEKRNARILDLGRALDACARTKNTNLKQLAVDALMAESYPDKEYSLFVKTFFNLHGINNVI